MIAWTRYMDALVGTDSDDKIGKQLGLAGTTVWKRRRELGRPPAIAPGPREKRRPEVLKGGIYAAERTRGLTVAQVAELHDVHPFVVWRAIRRWRERSAA